MTNRKDLLRRISILESVFKIEKKNEIEKVPWEFYSKEEQKVISEASKLAKKAGGISENQGLPYIEMSGLNEAEREKLIEAVCIMERREKEWMSEGKGIRRGGKSSSGGY